MLLRNIARLRLQVGDIAGARSLVRQAIALPVVDGSAADTIRPQLVAIMAQAALQAGDLSEARRLVERRFAGVDLAKTTIAYREAHQTAYDVYTALDEPALALPHLAALKRLDDQATELATSATSALAAARFDFANQELRLATLQRDDATRQAEFARQRARTERSIFIGVVAATAVVIALLGGWLTGVRRARRREQDAARDLSRSNDALGKALAAKTEFLATTSHEIRTPLNGILGMTQVMLADPGMAPDTRGRLGVVHSAGLTMRALVDDILDVAKMEAGNLQIECAPFDCAATLRDAVQLWVDQARAKGIALNIDLDQAPRRIAGDAARVRQIAFNLLSNAFKFTSSGSVRLSATADGDTYRIAVADTGIGIPADKTETIFESFQQADAGTTRQFGGTGLGLAICRNLVVAMEGRIEVASIEGSGSTFTVTLPLHLSCDDEPDVAAPSADGRVVLIDAAPIGRSMLSTLVARRREAPLAMASLDEALALGGAAEMIVVDQNAVPAGFDPAALMALGPIVWLWRGTVPPAIAAAGRVVAKPIAAPLLVEALFDAQDAGALVPRAA